MIRTTLPILMLIVTIAALFGLMGQGSAANLDRTPIATSSTEEVRGFPFFLGCDYVDAIGEGPAWEGITIGQTTLSELESRLRELSPDYRNSPFHPYTWFLPGSDSGQVTSQRIPASIEACIINNTVAALQLQVILHRERVYLVDFLAEYGLPDVVTWGGMGFTDRVAFWFERGIAVNFEIGEAYAHEDVSGYVLSIVYFPFQAAEGYRNRWPFNRTRQRPFRPHEFYPTPSPVNLQATMNALSTAPTRTPTPTFTPWSTLTATRTPFFQPTAQ